MADVGTDHGYIPIYLVKNNICTKAIAMDIKKGPLERAREHIGEHRLDAYIEIRLSDGLKALLPKEVASIVIAGMGGATMMKILTEGSEAAEAARELILQPQSERMELRSFLAQEGYHILEEDMIFEDGKYYPMMRVKKTKEIRVGENGFQRIELKYGPCLLKQRHPVLREYLIWQKEQKEKVLIRVCQNAAPKSREKRALQIREELKDISEALALYRER